MRHLLVLAGSIALVSCGGDRDAKSQSGEEQSGDRPDSPLITRYDDLAAVVNANGASPYQGQGIQFGAQREEVDAAFQQAFGNAPERSTNQDCGAGPMEFSRFGPLQLGFMDGRFAGWYLQESPIGGAGAKDGVATSDGVRPGVTLLSDLKSERPVRELETTIDGEFQYETMDYGTVTGFADGDGIAALQAGIGCVFR
ncbi:hypothetical protein [Erythrobacter sp. SD-21]|uniref:hypothetical protein n=1 Tax=Erythrobacter sp. SD-21 TaxID=161528 RepID=UPI000153F660|nr:hypothetical protein [Erythrobacter sp. SD-21]EDL50517.1 hypothetical protein ED21_28638 [Erythrobacter sp. SD-21]